MAECSNFKFVNEVPVLLLFFAFLFGGNVTTNLVMYRTCYVSLGYNKTECALLGSQYSTNSTQHLEELVQPHASVILMTKSMIETVASSICGLFLGPWSDKYGRKLVLLCSLIGFMMAYIVTATISVIDTISAWYLILSAVPVILTGGFSSFLSVALCYITDVTDESNRGIRIGIFEGVMGLGVLLGTLSSSFVFDAGGYLTIYSICAGCTFTAWLYMFVFMQESVTNVQTEGKFKNLFDSSLIVEMMKTTFKRREYHERTMLILAIVILASAVLAITADGGIVYLYLREKFQWSLETYNLFFAANSSAFILSTVIGVYLLHNILHIKETCLIMAGLISMASGAVIQGLANKPWQIFIGAAVRCMGGFISPMIRTFISKIAPADEAGKVFSLTVGLETITTVIASPLYTYVYNSTLTTNSGLFNFFTAGIFGVSVVLNIILIIVEKIHHQHIPYTVLPEQ